jgi:hypothetical protein
MRRPLAVSSYIKKRDRRWADERENKKVRERERERERGD